MKYFTLLKGDQIVSDKKIIPASEFSLLMEAKEIVERATQEAAEYKEELAEEAKKIKQEAEKEGFEEGLRRWNEQLADLEQQKITARLDLQKSIHPLLMTAIRKILGREIDLHAETIVDIIATSVKAVAQHRNITLYVRRADLEAVEAERPRLKALFENLQSLAIVVREDIAAGGCIIETERGIINVSLDSQLAALENAFKAMLAS